MKHHIILAFDWILVLIAAVDIFMDARKMYKGNKYIVDYVIRTYPYRLLLISIWLIRALFIMFTYK